MVVAGAKMVYMAKMRCCSIALWAMMALSTFSVARCACDDIDKYFANVESGGEIDLGSVIRVDCLPNADAEELEEIVVKTGTTLTIKSTQPFVRFVNVRFTVEDEAKLNFDMPVTRIGPNSGDSDNAPGYVFDVYDDAVVTFAGKFRASRVRNVRSLFYNSGTIEFKGDTLFNNNGNVFRSNIGTLKFRGDTVFKNNLYLGIDNSSEDAYVRFSKTAVFDNNGDAFDGALGCGVSNRGTVIFRGDAHFLNHTCTEGAAVANRGKMRFYGKAYFDNNKNYRELVGGLWNSGDLVFKGAAQFNGNEGELGGGLVVTGGEVIFEKAVAFDSNGSETTGGAFSVLYMSTLTFDKPDVVRTSDNFILEGNEPVTGCSLGYVEEGATLVGFDVDDVCVEETVE